MAIGLPIKMVVLTIVGMAGLAAMIPVINSSQDTIPKPLHANLKSVSLIILSDLSETDVINFSIQVLNSNDGSPVEKASVSLFGLSASSINLTDKNGETLLRFHKQDFEMDVNEGYLKLDVRKTGFKVYDNDFAVKIIK